MAGFQIPMTSEGEIRAKRPIGRIFSETNFLNIFAASVKGDFVSSASGGNQDRLDIPFPEEIEFYLAGTFNDPISYFIELEYNKEAGEGLSLGKEAFIMIDLASLVGSGHTAHQGKRMVHGPMVMAGKIDPSTNFSYPTNRQIIGIAPYAFASKFFGIKTTNGNPVSPTQSVLYNTPGDSGIDFHAMVGATMFQAGLMQGLADSNAGDQNSKKDFYLMGRRNFGGTGYLSGSFSGFGYRGSDTARVGTSTTLVETSATLVDWYRTGVAANIKYRFLDLYGAFIQDTIKADPATLVGFDPKANGLTIEADYLITDQILGSLRYDHLHAGGLNAEKSDGSLITVQGRYSPRENLWFYLRDSVNTKKVNSIADFRNQIAFGVDFLF